MVTIKKDELDRLIGLPQLTKEEANLPFDFKKYPGAMLIKAAPSLWSKVDTATLTKKEQRAKFEALIVWFCKKNEYKLDKNITQKYSHQGKMVEGRISYRLSSDIFSCLVELIFDSDLTVAAKMKAALNNSEYPIILKVGKSNKELEAACHGFMLVNL